MSKLRYRVGQGCADIIPLQVRKICEDFVLARSIGQQFEHIDHANAHATEARVPMALLGPNGDTGQKTSVHPSNIMELLKPR